MTVTHADNTAPTLTDGAVVTRTSDTAATIVFTTNEAGTAYYLVVESGAAAPANTTVKGGTSLGAVPASAVSDKAVVLAAGAKDIYVVVEDAAGNISNPLKIPAAVYAPDNAAPILTAGAVSRASDTAATVGFTTDEAGTAYYLVVESGATLAR
ncbi:hypothetical protein FACS1894167_15790 [Synergistales bacterium]|nr:hypothetical protein FACS1894167_15790 [Synergistales bacterium]